MKKTTWKVLPMAHLRTLLLLLLLPAVACKKNDTATVAPVAALLPIQFMATALNGEVFNGSISTESDEDGLALWCNNKKVLIGIGKLASSAFTDPGNIENAQVIYSNFGVIIRDPAQQKTWLYIQHDAQSRQRFEQLQSNTANAIVSEITETIRLNIS